MIKSGKDSAKHFNAEEVRKIRAELPREMRGRFPLKGETREDLLKVTDPHAARLSRQAEATRSLQDLEGDGEIPLRRRASGKWDTLGEKIPSNHPVSYSAETFLTLCITEASRTDNAGMKALERAMFDLCLDPAVKLDAAGPWFFAQMVDALRSVCRNWTDTKAASIVVTSLGQKICSALDYTRHSRYLSLSVGAVRTGKTFSAKAWCEQRPGAARFVEVPPGNDDGGFYRAIARGIGLGNFSQYNSCDLRERVESVLLAGDLVLVLDEAQRLWPLRNFREGFPMRIEWVMAMTNAGVPIALISSAEFFARQTIAEKNGWNSAQLVGRIGHYNPLPTALEHDDLVAVAHAVLPDAGADTLRALAVYAKSSARHLAAIDSIASHARYIATESGRTSPTIADVRAAMSKSVIPSDTKLLYALEQTKKRQRARIPAGGPDVPSTTRCPDVEVDNVKFTRETVPTGIIDRAI
jgi:hypothetical protein